MPPVSREIGRMVMRGLLGGCRTLIGLKIAGRNGELEGVASAAITLTPGTLRGSASPTKHSR